MIFSTTLGLEFLTICKPPYYRPPTKYTCSSILHCTTSHFLTKRTANNGWVLLLTIILCHAVSLHSPHHRFACLQYSLFPTLQHKPQPENQCSHPLSFLSDGDQPVLSSQYHPFSLFLYQASHPPTSWASTRHFQHSALSLRYH